MPDKKLTDSEIVKDLQKEIQDSKRINSSYALLNLNLLKETVDLINCLKAENKRLSTLAELGNKRADDYRVMRDRALKAEAENERLKPFEDKIAEFNSHIRVEDMLVFASSLEEWLEFCENLKTEAYKEFAERLEAEYTDFDEENEVILPENLNKAINNLLKELVGEDK